MGFEYLRSVPVAGPACRIGFGEGREEAIGTSSQASEQRRSGLPQQLGVSGQQTGVEQRSCDVDVIEGGSNRLALVANRMADREPGVPERVDDGTDARRLCFFAETLDEEEHVYVGTRAQFTAPIPADRDDRETAALQRHLVVQLLEDDVDLCGPCAAPGPSFEGARAFESLPRRPQGGSAGSPADT